MTWPANGAAENRTQLLARPLPRAGPRLTSLRRRHQADIAIVGGGVTGCAAALLFARAGARVILVEGRRLGRGSTAASTALLMQEPDVDLADLAERYGAAVARRIWTCSRRAVASIRRTLAGLGVSSLCGLPSLYYAADATDARLVQARARPDDRLFGFGRLSA